MTAESERAELVTQRASDVPPRALHWLWPSRVPKGKITLVAGEPKTSKSLLTGAYMAATVSTGRRWVDGASCEQGNVLIVQAEDAANDTIVPRLHAAGANLDRIHILSHVQSGSVRSGFSFDFIEPLRRKIEELGDVRLVVLDPIGSFCGTADTNRDSEVRNLIGALKPVAEETDVALVLVAHYTKNDKTRKINRVNGSIAFVGVARVAFSVQIDPDDKGRRLFLHIGGNVGRPPRGLAYRVESAPAFTRDGERFDDVAVIRWEGEVDEDPDAEERPGPAPERRRSAAEFLRSLLSGGALASAQVRAAAAAAGLAWRTVERAKRELGIPSDPAPPYLWSLPVAR